MKMKNEITVGYEKGNVCNRNGCLGIIDEHEKEGSCSCHINPPCSTCVDDRHFCPECHWSGLDDQNAYSPYSPEQIETFKKENEKFATDQAEKKKKIRDAYEGKIMLDKLEYYVSKQWHSGYEATGYKPPWISKEELLKKFNFDLPRYSINAHGGFIISGFTD